MTTYNHLAEDTQLLLELSNEQRARHMLMDRFITHDRLEPILDHIEFLRFSPTQSRAAGLVVYGRPGSGKTMLAKAILRRYPRSPTSPVAAATRPVLMISMTGAREAKTLHNRMLTALDCPLSVHSTGSDRERLVFRLCRAAELQLLVVDEIQDILTSTARQQRMALDTIKFLMNELSLPILALGTLQAKAAMEVDEHLNARFRSRELPVWKADAFLGNFLDALEMRLPLKQRSCLSSPTLMKALIHVSNGTLDTIVKTICFAAAHAVEQGIERVTIELVELASHTPPVVAVRSAGKVPSIQPSTLEAA
jgi:hypothetical protein